MNLPFPSPLFPGEGLLIADELESLRPGRKTPALRAVLKALRDGKDHVELNACGQVPEVQDACKGLLAAISIVLGRRREAEWLVRVRLWRDFEHFLLDHPELDDLADLPEKGGVQ